MRKEPWLSAAPSGAQELKETRKAVSGQGAPTAREDFDGPQPSSGSESDPRHSLLPGRQAAAPQHRPSRGPCSPERSTARPERRTPRRPRNPAPARLSGPRRSAGSAVQREPRPPAAASSRSAGTGQRARAAGAQSRQLPARRRSSSGLAPSGRTHPQPGPGSSWRAGGRSTEHRAEHRAPGGAPSTGRSPRPPPRPAGPAPQQRPALLARRAARSKRASHWPPAAKGRGSAGSGVLPSAVLNFIPLHRRFSFFCVRLLTFSLEMLFRTMFFLQDSPGPPSALVHSGHFLHPPTRSQQQCSGTARLLAQALVRAMAAPRFKGAFENWSSKTDLGSSQ